MPNSRENPPKYTPVRREEFSSPIKSDKRAKFYAENPQLVGTLTEAHHENPIFNGGTSDPDNCVILTREQHAGVHLRHTLYESDVLNSEISLGSAKSVITRCNSDEFWLMCLNQIRPMLPDIENHVKARGLGHRIEPFDPSDW
jgi:hypothetical protein